VIQHNGLIYKPKESDPLFVHEGFLPNSPAEIRLIKAFIQEKGISLVLVDSLSVFWNVADENNNAAVVREVKPLLALARDTGAAVCLIHHDNKTGGAGGRNIRGGSSLFGLVDQAIMLDHLPGEGGNKRLLKTLGRYTPSELVIELTDGKYQVIGTRQEAGKQAIVDKALEYLTIEPRDIKTIVQEIDEKETSTRKVLKELCEAGKVILASKGTKGNPATYRLPVPSDSLLSQPPLIVKERNNGTEQNPLFPEGKGYREAL